MPFTVNTCKKCPAFKMIDMDKMIDQNMGSCSILDKVVLWDAIDETCPFLPENEGKPQRAQVKRG